MASLDYVYLNVDILQSIRLIKLPYIEASVPRCYASVIPKREIKVKAKSLPGCLNFATKFSVAGINSITFCRFNRGSYSLPAPSKGQGVETVLRVISGQLVAGPKVMFGGAKVSTAKVVGAGQLNFYVPRTVFLAVVEGTGLVSSETVCLKEPTAAQDFDNFFKAGGSFTTDKFYLSNGDLIHRTTGAVFRPRNVRRWTRVMDVSLGKRAFFYIRQGRMSVLTYTDRRPTVKDFILGADESDCPDLPLGKFYCPRRREYVGSDEGWCWLRALPKQHYVAAHYSSVPSFLYISELKAAVVGPTRVHWDGRTPVLHVEPRVPSSVPLEYRTMDLRKLPANFKVAGERARAGEELVSTISGALASDDMYSSVMANIVNRLVLKDQSNLLTHVDQQLYNLLTSREQALKKKNRLVVRAHLDDKQKKALKTNFPELSLDFADSVKSNHPMCNAIRQCFNSLFRAYYHSTNFIDVGGSMRAHVQAGCQGVHCCNPVLDKKDVARRLRESIEMEMQLDDVSTFSTLQKEYSARSMTTCSSPTQYCDHAGAKMMMVDVYDLHVKELVESMARKSTVICNLCLMMPVEVLGGDGTIYIEALDVTVQREGDILTYFIGASGDAYVHSLEKVASYFHCPYVQLASGQCYSVGYEGYRLGYHHIVITLQEPSVLPAVLRRAIPTTYDGKAMVTIPKLTDNILTFKSLVIDADFVERTYSYCLAAVPALEARTFEYAVGSVRSQKTHVITGTRVVHEKVELDTDDIWGIVITLVSKGVADRMKALHVGAKMKQNFGSLRTMFKHAVNSLCDTFNLKCQQLFLAFILRNAPVVEALMRLPVDLIYIVPRTVVLDIQVPKPFDCSIELPKQSLLLQKYADDISRQRFKYFTKAYVEQARMLIKKSRVGALGQLENASEPTAEELAHYICAHVDEINVGLRGGARGKSSAIKLAVKFLSRHLGPTNCKTKEAKVRSDIFPSPSLNKGLAAVKEIADFEASDLTVVHQDRKFDWSALLNQIVEKAPIVLVGIGSLTIGFYLGKKVLANRRAIAAWIKESVSNLKKSLSMATVWVRSASLSVYRSCAVQVSTYGNRITTSFGEPLWHSLRSGRVVLPTLAFLYGRYFNMGYVGPLVALKMCRADQTALVLGYFVRHMPSTQNNFFKSCWEAILSTLCARPYVSAAGVMLILFNICTADNPTYTVELPHILPRTLYDKCSQIINYFSCMHPVFIGHSQGTQTEISSAASSSESSDTIDLEVELDAMIRQREENERRQMVEPSAPVAQPIVPIDLSHRAIQESAPVVHLADLIEPSDHNRDIIPESQAVVQLAESSQTSRPSSVTERTLGKKPADLDSFGDQTSIPAVFEHGECASPKQNSVDLRPIIPVVPQNFPAIVQANQPIVPKQSPAITEVLEEVMGGRRGVRSESTFQLRPTYHRSPSVFNDRKSGFILNTYEFMKRHPRCDQLSWLFAEDPIQAITVKRALIPNDIIEGIEANIAVMEYVLYLATELDRLFGNLCVAADFAATLNYQVTTFSRPHREACPGLRIYDDLDAVLYHNCDDHLRVEDLDYVFVAELRCFSKPAAVKNLGHGKVHYLVCNAMLPFHISMNLKGALALSRRGDVGAHFQKTSLHCINAPPGGGKTTKLVDRYFAENQNAVILTANIGSSEDINRLIAERSGLVTEDSQKIPRVSRTVNSGVIHAKPHLNKGIVLIDEMYLMHQGLLMLGVFSSGCQRAVLYGDMNQIPFINRVAMFKTENAVYQPPTSNIEFTDVTYRCPLDVCYIMSKMKRPNGELCYPKKVVNPKKNVVMRSLSKYPVAHVSDVAKENPDVFLCFTQEEKKDLTDELRSQRKPIVVQTVHEAQGKTFGNVVLFRLKKADDNVFDSQPHVLVALTRHTNSLKYLTWNSKLNDTVGKAVDSVSHETVGDAVLAAFQQHLLFRDI